MYNFGNGVKRYGYSIPYDADDFGRCYRLFIAVPEWKARIQELKQMSSVWAGIVDEWENLSELYESGNFDEIYQIIHVLCDKDN